MAAFDGFTIALLILVGGLAAAIVSLVPRWRRLMGGGHHLPVREFLRLRPTPVDERTALRAALYCELCATKAQCRRLAEDGAAAPHPGCPNAGLLSGPGAGA